MLAINGYKNVLVKMEYNADIQIAVKHLWVVTVMDLGSVYVDVMIGEFQFQPRHIIL